MLYHSHFLNFFFFQRCQISSRGCSSGFLEDAVKATPGWETTSDPYYVGGLASLLDYLLGPLHSIVVNHLAETAAVALVYGLGKIGSICACHSAQLGQCERSVKVALLVFHADYQLPIYHFLGI